MLKTLKRYLMTAIVVSLLGIHLGMLSAQPQERFILMASTTSTQDSGLFKHLLPIFKEKTGIEVRVVAQGTGQALSSARKGDADVVFVHDKVAELKFVEDGFGVDRRDVMYNDFIIVGPKNDPAKINNSKDVLDSLRRIANARSPFTSRGDKSGTHAAELRYWQASNIDPSQAKGSWYRETGSGMGATLNVASALDAYAFTDRGTWLSFKNRGQLALLVEGDSKLLNQYGVMLVNPAKHPHVKKDMANLFINWLTSPEGQSAIDGYKLNGQPFFFSNFKR
jgi:tungstate transport system substrate-binding protein